MADPWLKFYPTDWRSDPALRMCGLAARGLWMEMIALMHEAVPYGHLLVAGRSPTDTQLAVLVGASPDQIPELLGELDAAGVFSRTREGVIYSRKMTRTAKKAAIAKKNGKNGGNPLLCKKRENQPSDNQQLKGQDKPQKPEARSQKEEDTNVSLSVSPTLPAVQPKDPGPSFSAFWEVWPLGKIAKQAAEKAWRKLSAQDRAAAIDRAVGWGAQWLSDHPTANPIHPASYLNSKRWTDEIQPKFTLIPGGQNEPSRQDHRATARTDALRDQLNVAGRMRRTSEPNWI